MRAPIRLLLLLALLSPLGAVTVAWAQGADSAGPSSAASLQGVKGHDDRVGLEAFEAPWSAVGRVNNRVSASWCTGALIAPRLVLTAAHCLWNKLTMDWLPVVSVHFVAAYSRGEYLASSEINAFHVGPDYDPKADYTTRNGAHDWAILELRDDLGSKAGYFGISALPAVAFDPKGRVVQVGYSQDRRHIQTANLACAFDSLRQDGLALHSCDAVHGDSGSPIFRWRDGAYQIVAIHVSTLSLSNGKTYGGAVPSAAFIDKAKSLGATDRGAAGSLSRSPVRTVQLILPRFGIEPGNIDGAMDKGTETAIREFERRARLPVTGRASIDLLGHMLMVMR